MSCRASAGYGAKGFRKKWVSLAMIIIFMHLSIIHPLPRFPLKVWKLGKRQQKYW